MGLFEQKTKTKEQKSVHPQLLVLGRRSRRTLLLFSWKQLQLNSSQIYGIRGTHRELKKTESNKLRTTSKEHKKPSSISQSHSSSKRKKEKQKNLRNCHLKKTDEQANKRKKATSPLL